MGRGVASLMECTKMLKMVYRVAVIAAVVYGFSQIPYYHHPDAPAHTEVDEHQSCEWAKIDLGAYRTINCE
jgi:hypothetical protein